MVVARWSPSFVSHEKRSCKQQAAQSKCCKPKRFGPQKLSTFRFCCVVLTLFLSLRRGKNHFAVCWHQQGRARKKKLTVTRDNLNFFSLVYRRVTHLFELKRRNKSSYTTQSQAHAIKYSVKSPRKDYRGKH